MSKSEPALLAKYCCTNKGFDSGSLCSVVQEKALQHKNESVRKTVQHELDFHNKIINWTIHIEHIVKVNKNRLEKHWTFSKNYQTITKPEYDRFKRLVLTFLDPANPSDSVKKYANGIARNIAMYVPRNIWFHNPSKKKFTKNTFIKTLHSQARRSYRMARQEKNNKAPWHRISLCQDDT